METELPQLLPLDPSEDVSNLINYEKLLEPMQTDKKKGEEEDEEISAPAEWILQVGFSKEFTEKQLESAFQTILHPNEVPSPKVQFIGLCIVDKRRGEVAEVPLFIGALEEMMKQVKKPKGKSKSKKPKQIEPKFNEVYCIINLIAPRVGQYIEEEESEDEEHEHDEKHAHMEDSNEEDLQPELLDEKDLKKLHDSIFKCARALDKQAQIHTEEDIKKAAARANRLAEMCDFCNRYIVVSLIPEKGYKGLNVWDVMSCLGMSYDIDMHAFIVADEENGALFFSVNTHPSALMDPVNLSNPETKLPCLVFECFAAHCYDPLESVKSMIVAAKYAQKRLGGKLVDENSNPIDEESLLKETKEVVDDMMKCGVKPGSMYALDLL